MQLDKYQEQSQLLDPHLEDLLSPPMATLKAMAREVTPRGLMRIALVARRLQPNLRRNPHHFACFQATTAGHRA